VISSVKVYGHTLQKRNEASIKGAFHVCLDIKHGSHLPSHCCNKYRLLNVLIRHFTLSLEVNASSSILGGTRLPVKINPKCTSRFALTAAVTETLTLYPGVLPSLGQSSEAVKTGKDW